MTGHDSTATLLAAIANGLQIIDLARPMTVGMPQSPNHPAYSLTMPRKHGDKVRDDGGSAANDLLTTGTHAGTHIDALGHVSHCGLLYGGVDAARAQQTGRLSALGVDTIAPIVCRGLLLDVAEALGVQVLPGGYEITPDDLDGALRLTGCTPVVGDVLLVRSGWGAHWGDSDTYVGRDCGVPGVGEAGAKWLASHHPRAVGADTIAFEHLPAGAGHAVLPAHRVLLVEEGINIIETMELDTLAHLGHRQFVFVVAPLALVGATGSPVRPLAIVAA